VELGSTLERIHHRLYVAVGEQAGREASPTVAIIDTQTAKGAQKGVLAQSFRYDAGRKIRAQAAYPGRYAGSPVDVVHSADVGP
jgi:hypothetical protein